MWIYDHRLLNLSAGVLNLRLLLIGHHSILILKRWRSRAFKRIRGLSCSNLFIAILHGKNKLTIIGNAELASFNRLDTLMKVIPVELLERKDHDLLLPLHSGLKVVPNKYTRLRCGFEPRTIFSLGLGSNPVIDPTSKR